MDRIVELKVFGNHLIKDSNKAGTRGESNITNLRITFDEGWDGYAKEVVFWDAFGENAVRIELTTNLLENIVDSTRVFLVPIPAEAMSRAGMLTFSIIGSLDNKKQKSITGELRVEDSPVILEPIDPTPNELQQVRTEIAGMVEAMRQATVSAQEAATSAQDAELSRLDAANYKDDVVVMLSFAEEARNAAEGFVAKAEEFAEESKGFVKDAESAANKAEVAISHNPVIVDGYWHVWSAQGLQYVNTGIKAQSGSVVYVGENPPAEADVWIDPNGESNSSIPTYAFVNILGGAENWEAEEVKDASGNVIGVRYGQTVNVNNAVITEHSKVDLQITSEQLVVFYQKDIAFVAENDGGVVTVYCVGSIPQNDYKIQAIVTEVTVNG